MLALCKQPSRESPSIHADGHLLRESKPLNTFCGY
jgi:hypothetical protein